MHHTSVRYEYAMLHGIEHNMIERKLNHHAKRGYRCIQILPVEHGQVDLVIERRVTKKTFLGPG